MPKLDSLPNVLLTLFDLGLDAPSFIGTSLRPRVLWSPRTSSSASNWLCPWTQGQTSSGEDGYQVDPGVAFQPVCLARGAHRRLAHTSIRWHRKGFRLFWRWKSKPRGRPRIPAELQNMIEDMAQGNLTWGEDKSQRKQ